MNITKTLEIYDSLCGDCHDQQSISLHLDEDLLPVKFIHGSPKEAGCELEIGLSFRSSLPFVGLRIDSVCGRAELVRQCIMDLHRLKSGVLVDQSTAGLFVLQKLFEYNPKFGLGAASLSYRDYFLWNVFVSQMVATKSNNRVSVDLRGDVLSPIKGRVGFLIALLRLRWMIK